MSKGVVYQDDDYKIIATEHDYVLRNRKGKYKHHGHFMKLSTCHLMIRLINDKEVPKSTYLRKAALRISTDGEYIEKVKNKINRDADKSHYINVNKGAKNLRKNLRENI